MEPKKFISFLSLFFFLSFVPYSGAVTKTGMENKILCLGDSITLGAGDEELTTQTWGYRDHLQQFLGSGYIFVGSKTDPDTNPDNNLYEVNHEGVSGEQVSQIEARTLTALTTYMSGDVGHNSAVLLHGGTNDCADGISNTVTRDNIEDIIDIINAFNPNIKVYVALPIPSNNSTVNTCLATLNPLLQTMLLTYQATKSNLVIVDHYSRWLANASYVADWISGVGTAHPNDAGYQIMADTWYDCMVNPSATYCNVY